MDSLLSLVPNGIDLALEDVEEILRFARSLGIKRVSNKNGAFKVVFNASREQALSSGKVRIAANVSFNYANRGDFIELTNISGIEGLLNFTLFGRQVLPWVPVLKVRLSKHERDAALVRIVAEVDAPVLGAVSHEVLLPASQVPIFKQAFAARVELKRGGDMSWGKGLDKSLDTDLVKGADKDDKKN